MTLIIATSVQDRRLPMNRSLAVFTVTCTRRTQNAVGLENTCYL